MAQKRDKYGRFVKKGQKLPKPARDKSGRFKKKPVKKKRPSPPPKPKPKRKPRRPVLRPSDIARALGRAINTQFAVSRVTFSDEETFPGGIIKQREGWRWHQYRVEFYEVVGVEVAGVIARLAWPVFEPHYHRQARVRIEVAEVQKGEVVDTYFFTLTNTDHTRAAFFQVANAVADMNHDVSGQYSVLVAIEFELRV